MCRRTYHVGVHRSRISVVLHPRGRWEDPQSVSVEHVEHQLGSRLVTFFDKSFSLRMQLTNQYKTTCRSFNSGKVTTCARMCRPRLRYEGRVIVGLIGGSWSHSISFVSEPW